MSDPRGSPVPVPLISTGELESILGSRELRILDGSWYLPASGRDPVGEYRTGHIPGAVFFDLDRASDPDSPLPHMLPSPDLFQSVASEAGVGPDTSVVVYDGSGCNLSAARVWWMFRVFGHARVAVLDGGLAKWREEGRRLESGAVIPQPARFVARLDPGQVATLGQVLGASQSGFQVVDVRSAGRFRGTVAEPRPVPSGHIPRSLNLPCQELVGDQGVLRSAAELRRLMGRAGIDPDQPVIATCGSGTSAAALLLALERIGTTGHQLYDGSWTEYASSGHPIETGP